MATAPNTHYDAIELMKRGLSDLVLKQLEDELVAPRVQAFEEEIRATLRDHLRRVTFDRVETFKDMIGVRDELHVHIQIDEESSV